MYTREAHPGEHFPAIQSLDQKVAHAREFQRRYDIQRPVLVDSVEGLVHNAYGKLPNMTYIVSRSGKVLFRADWTDPATIQGAITFLQHARQRRRDGLRLKPFYAELVGYRWTDDPAFMAGLNVAGPQAVADFEAAMQRWRSGEPLKGELKIEE